MPAILCSCHNFSGKRCHFCPELLSPVRGVDSGHSCQRLRCFQAVQLSAGLTMALSVETESHIYRALRTASGAAAHLVALGFTIFVAVLARPGSSK